MVPPGPQQQRTPDIMGIELMGESFWSPDRLMGQPLKIQRSMIPGANRE